MTHVLRDPPEFDEPMLDAPKEKKAPLPGSDAYYEAFGDELDERPFGVPHHRGPKTGAID